MIKLLAFDLDGTTITEHRYLSEENRAALLKAEKRGVILVPATGRMRYFIPEVITSLPGVRYVITSNGAAVYDLVTGETVYQRLIPNKKAVRVVELLKRYDVYVEYYRNGEAVTQREYVELARTKFHFPVEKLLFVDGKKYNLVTDLLGALQATGDCPEKINLPFLERKTRDELWEKLSFLGGLDLTSSIADNIEINDAGAHKGAALLALAERLGIRGEETMAVGDNGNDVTMLEAAGCSAAVADGSPEALAAAKFITAAHDQDGLAKAIERYILA